MSLCLVYFVTHKKTLCVVVLLVLLLYMCCDLMSVYCCKLIIIGVCFDSFTFLVRTFKLYTVLQTGFHFFLKLFFLLLLNMP